jgi:hypothetical protein
VAVCAAEIILAVLLWLRRTMTVGRILALAVLHSSSPPACRMVARRGDDQPE